MDSDIDADTPIRMRSHRKVLDTDSKSPLLPFFANTLQKSNKSLSPTSAYSTKSSKDQLDVTEIRRILRKLKIELDTERKKNEELVDANKRLEEHGDKIEGKYRESMTKLNSNWKRKSEDALRNLENVKNNEITQLQQKIEHMSSKLVTQENGMDYANVLDIITTIENLFNHTNVNSNDCLEMKKNIDNLKMALDGKSQKENLESKLSKLKNHNNELIEMVKMLDQRLINAKTEIEALTKKLEVKSHCQTVTDNCADDDSKQNVKFEDTLQRANFEIIQLQKQITWLKNSDNGDPATKERVEVLSKLIQSFKDSQHNLELEVCTLREKCKNVDLLTEQLSKIKNENQILVAKFCESTILQKNVDTVDNTLSRGKASDCEKLFKSEKTESSNNHYINQSLTMDRLLKYIRETSEKRTELELEYAAMKTLLETKLQHKFLKQKDQNQCDNEDNSEDSTENLKVKLREMEKRRTQQSLNYEEALLELEALKKNNQRQNIDFYRRNGANDDVNNSSASSVMEGLLNNMDIGKVDTRESSIFGRPDCSSVVSEEEMKYLMNLKNNGGENVGLMKEVGEAVLRSSALSLDAKMDKQRKHIAAPVQIRIENQSGTRILRWKTPESVRNTEDCQITAYHIYMNGDFYKAIGANDPLSTALPNLDSKTHRVSIRSVCPHGQSKDPQCTIDINSESPAPTVLKANKITGTSAHVSWMPSNSTLRHSVWVNGVKFCDCLPGIYKILLEGLKADSLQKVRVHPVINQYPDSTTISAYLDFQTLPVSSETKRSVSKKQLGTVIEEIEAPRDVKLKLGNRSGRFLVRWTCCQDPASPSIKLVGYSILINNQCVALVNGAKNDRFSLNLIDLRGISLPINQKLLNINEQSYLPLTVRTLGTMTETDATDCTVQSKDSQPPLKFSGQVAARIAGTAAEAAMMLGDQLAFFLNLNSRSPKASTKDHSQAKMSVPKIQITKDSSFSEDDENLSMTQYKSKVRPAVVDPYKDKFQQRSGPSQYSEYPSRPGQIIDDQTGMKPQPKNFQNNSNERVPTNQRSANYNNGIADNNAPQDRYYYGGQQSTTDQIRYFVALYDYDPGTMSPNPDAINEELPFKIGQTVKIFGQVDEDGFYTGETNGRRGLVPSNMVKEVDNVTNKSKYKPIDNNNGEFVDKGQKRNSEVPASRNIQNRPNVGPYSSETHREYSPNQYIGNQGPQYDPYQVAHRKSTDSGVSNAASDPNSYQKPQIQNNVPRQSSTANTAVSLNGKRMVALYDYDPQVLSPNVDSDAELAFKANDIIIIRSEIDEDGFYLGERNGQRGLVPSNFLTEAVPSTNRLKNQQSFDGSQNQIQFKERNFSASSNFSDPPPVRDNRFRPKVLENERDPGRSNQLNNGDYVVERSLEVEHPKHIANTSFEESFDSGPTMNRPYVPKPEAKRAPYPPSLERRGSINNNEPRLNSNEHQYPRTVPSNNSIPSRITKPTDERRIIHDKPNHPSQSVIKLPLRRQSPPPPLEQDDMPIVMDLAPSKDNQKKKKLSSVPDNYRTNLSDTHDNYGNNDNLYANSNSSMSENLERKRSVFKNPFKKKKS